MSVGTNFSDALDVVRRWCSHGDLDRRTMVVAVDAGAATVSGAAPGRMSAAMAVLYGGNVEHSDSCEEKGEARVQVLVCVQGLV